MKQQGFLKWAQCTGIHNKDRGDSREVKKDSRVFAWIKRLQLKRAAYSATGEHLQKPHTAGSRPQVRFFNTLLSQISRQYGNSMRGHPPNA
jgi:hypothetical protein